MEELYSYVPHICVFLIVLGIILIVYPVAVRVASDICINPVTGKLAEKSTYAFGAYIVGMLTFLNDFVHLSFNPVFEFHFDKVPIEKQVLLFGAAGMLAGFNVAGKFFSRKTKDGYGNDLAPIVTSAPAPNISAPLEPMDAVNTEPIPEVKSECPAAKKAAEMEINANATVPFVAKRANDDEGVSK